MLAKAVIAALALSAVFAASATGDVTTTQATSTAKIASGCLYSATKTITDQVGVQEVNACSAIQGDLLFQGEELTSVILSVLYVYGDVIVQNATQLVSFNAANLAQVEGDFQLNTLQLLSDLNLANLNSVGTLLWQALPALGSTGLTATPGLTKAQLVTVTDTGLENLDGINAVNVAVYDVNNNKDMNNMNVELQTVLQTLNIQYNSQDLEVTLPALLWAGNLTVSDVSSFTVGLLGTVNGSVYITNNTLELLSFPNVTEVGSITITNNDDLTKVLFPELTAVSGAFVIANNTDLTDSGDFDSLKSVGNLIIEGAFKNASFPALTNVRGTFEFNSTGTASCDEFSGVTVHGKTYVCVSKSTTLSFSRSNTLSEDATSTNGGASDSSSKKSSSSSKAGAAAVVADSFVAGAAALGLAVLL